MPIELLVDIVKQGLPVTIADATSIDKLRVLRAARLVEADIPLPGDEGEAVVREITQEGQVFLERMRDEKKID